MKKYEIYKEIDDFYCEFRQDIIVDTYKNIILQKEKVIKTMIMNYGNMMIIIVR